MTLKDKIKLLTNLQMEIFTGFGVDPKQQLTEYHISDEQDNYR